MVTAIFIDELILIIGDIDIIFHEIILMKIILLVGRIDGMSFSEIKNFERI